MYHAAYPIALHRLAWGGRALAPSPSARAYLSGRAMWQSMGGDLPFRHHMRGEYPVVNVEGAL